jgi:hypothetical protein
METYMAVPNRNEHLTATGGEVQPEVTLTTVQKTFDPNKLPADSLINTRELATWTGLAIVTLEKWRLERKGPPFIRCESAVRYRVGDVRQWLQWCNGIDAQGMSAAAPQPK